MTEGPDAPKPDSEELARRMWREEISQEELELEIPLPKAQRGGVKPMYYTVNVGKGSDGLHYAMLSVPFDHYGMGDPPDHTFMGQGQTPAAALLDLAKAMAAEPDHPDCRPTEGVPGIPARDRAIANLCSVIDHLVLKLRAEGAWQNPALKVIVGSAKREAVSLVRDLEESDNG